MLLWMLAVRVCQALPRFVNRAGVYHLVRVAELDFLRRNHNLDKELLDGQAVQKLGRVADYPHGPDARQDR